MCCTRKSDKTQCKTTGNQTCTTCPNTTTQTETNHLTNNSSTPKRSTRSTLPKTLNELTAKPNRPKVFDVHKKIMSGERIEKKKTTQEIKQKEMEEAMQCLGLSVVNTTIIDRVEKANQVAPMEKSHYSSKATKVGDEKFPLFKSNRSGRQQQNDDTLNPHKETPPGTPKDDDEREVELIEDDVEEEPNSENYMYNTREIKYVNIDMIRNIDKTVIMEATGDPVLEGSGGKIDWDPMAPLSVMMSRHIFDCTNLRRNTFVTSAQSYPSKQEIEMKGKNKIVHKKPHVTLNIASKKLRFFRPENSIRTTITATDVSIDNLDKTQTLEEPCGRSTKNKKN